MSRQANGQGCVTQRNDGRCQVSIQVNGVRKTAYAGSEREARKKLAELQRQANGGILPNPGKRTVDDLLNLWLETAGKTLKPTTLEWYCTIAAKHVRPTLGKRKLSKLEPSHLQQQYGKLDGRIAQAVHRMLHRVCRWAVMWRWLDSNPADNVMPPVNSAPRKEVWTADELRRYLDGTAEHWLSPLWTLALASGCRIGELLALKWRDVNLETGTIGIRANLQRIKGKWLESSPKTRAGERSLTLPREAISALRRQRVQQAGWRLKAGGEWHDAGHVFTGEVGGPLHRSTVDHAMARECKRLDLPAMTPHGLRHLHASLLLRQRLPVPAVAARLGHSRPSITMSIYAHEIGDGDHEAAEAIGRALASS